MKKAFLFYFSLILIILNACSSSDNLSPIEDEQLVLFQYEYVNHAWGYQHSGWFIDNQGNIKEYSLPENWKWNHDSDYITKDSLEFNYQQANTTLKQIDIDELNAKKGLILATINGTLSEKSCPGADAGAYSLYSYYWDTSKNMYRKQLLNLSGDCKQQNTTSQAKQLTNWLNVLLD